jgi:hypothetical protein
VIALGFMPILLLVGERGTPRVAGPTPGAS